MGGTTITLITASSPPVKPYTSTAQVGMLLHNLLDWNSDFTTETHPTKVQVTQYLNWVSNQIDLQFQQAGYILPLVTISGESWPTHQSLYLQLVAALGAAALAGGYSLRPAPKIGPGRGNDTGNIFQELYNTELQKIYDPGTKIANSRFRAQVYSGTPAEYSITQPTGPSLDYMVGKINPEDNLSFFGYTLLKQNIQDYVEYNVSVSNPINWADFHGLFSTKLSGYSYQGLT